MCFTGELQNSQQQAHRGDTKAEHVGALCASLEMELNLWRDAESGDEAVHHCIDALIHLLIPCVAFPSAHNVLFLYLVVPL